MTSPAVGALVGLAFGTGLALAMSRVPAFRRPTLVDRLAPYLRDSPVPSRLLAPDPRSPRSRRWSGSCGRS